MCTLITTFYSCGHIKTRNVQTTTWLCWVMWWCDYFWWRRCFDRSSSCRLTLSCPVGLLSFLMLAEHRRKLCMPPFHRHLRANHARDILGQHQWYADKKSPRLLIRHILYILYSHAEKDYLASPGAEYEGLFNCDGVQVWEKHCSVQTSSIQNRALAIDATYCSRFGSRSSLTAQQSPSRIPAWIWSGFCAFLLLPRDFSASQHNSIKTTSISCSLKDWNTQWQVEGR